MRACIYIYFIIYSINLSCPVLYNFFFPVIYAINSSCPILDSIFSLPVRAYIYSINSSCPVICSINLSCPILNTIYLYFPIIFSINLSCPIDDTFFPFPCIFLVFHACWCFHPYSLSRSIEAAFLAGEPEIQLNSSNRSVTLNLVNR